MHPAIVPDKVKSRIQALLAKTVANGCTEEEALAAAAKVAELLDRHALSLTDVELRAIACERAVFETQRKKRIPLADAVGAIADFCNCRVWREKSPDGEMRFVFFGLPDDVVAAVSLAELVDGAVRAELGRYKTSPAYLAFRHQDRHLANASFALGMVTSIADKLDAMKAERDRSNRAGGRDLVVVKASVVDQDLRTLGISLEPRQGTGRTVSPDAYEAGEAAGSSMTIRSG